MHRHKEQIVRQPVLDTPRSPIDPPKEGLIEWFLEESEALLATLTNGNWPTALGLGREQALFAGDVESDDANLERNQLKEAESRLAQPIVKPPQPSQRAPKTP